MSRADVSVEWPVKLRRADLASQFKFDCGCGVTLPLPGVFAVSVAKTLPFLADFQAAALRRCG